MRIYIAGRYSRREELNTWAEELRGLGHEITARWLQGNHQLARGIGDDVALDCGRRYAMEDFADVQRADVVVVRTEPEASYGRNRGGRHVELGLALASGKRVIVVGFRENVFCFLPQVEFHDSWPEARRSIGRAAGWRGWPQLVVAAAEA